MLPFEPLNVEELLRNPRKGDRLLPSPTPLNRYQGTPADACAFGYRRAAQILVRYSRDYGDETFLFYPIVFLYRHHVELALKNLIFTFDDPAVRRVTGAEELSEADRESLSKGRKAHSLQWLWERLRLAVEALDNAVSHENIEGLSYYIMKLNEIDPGSVNFRYATAIEETKAKLEKEQKTGEVDIQTFAKGMERLANYLDGLDGYVGAIFEAHNDMLVEFYDSSY